MKPQINRTKFGSITIENKKYDHDIQITLSGEVEKRKKKLSKEVFGTSHILSLEEAEHVYQEGAQILIFGTGQSGLASLSDPAKDFFKKQGCQVKLSPTPQAVKAWNQASGKVIGLFHITC